MEPRSLNGHLSTGREGQRSQERVTENGKEVYRTKMLPRTALYKAEFDGERRKNKVFLSRAIPAKHECGCEKRAGESRNSVLEISTSPTLMCF